MNDSLPSTPSATPRHLKRLSLNTGGSPFSTASPSSPLSQPSQSPGGAATSASPSGIARSDSARRISSATRSLRLSNPPSAASALDPGTLFSSPTPRSRVESPTSTRTTTPRSAHARRTSSISYSSSPTIGSLAGGGPDAAFSPAAASAATSSPNQGSARVSFEGGRTRPSLDELAEERETEAATEGGQDLSEENCSPSDAGRVDEPINLGSGSALGILNAQATLTEQNADLLSFIAKKERKCLDLREELKRHESELSLLKNKWESIVARSFQQQQQQQSSTPRHASSQSFSTVSSASPNTSPTPRTASLHPASTHSLDLSLLSTTFDGSEILSSVASSASVGVDPRHRSAGSDPQIEIPESVKAAGNWLGGALGRVLEAAVGMPPPSEAPPELEGKRRERDGGAGGLEILREEDEENVDDNEADDLRESRRESRTSSIETESESTSGSAEKDSTAASSVQGDDAAPSAHAVKTSPLRRKPVPERSSSPHSSSSTARRLFSTSSAASAASSRGDNTFPPPRAASSLGASTSTSTSHARTRSSLASFSDSWSSLNKRWTDLTESETFKNSKRATLGLVDTFEQGLAQALGPLEPPSLSPAMSRQGSGSGSGDRERDRAHDRSPRPSPFLGPSSSSPHSPNPNGEDSRRRLTEVPISPMPGQALSSVFASWTRGKDKKDEEHEAARVDKGKAPAHDSEPNHHKNGFDWSAFQDQKGEGDEDVEEWPAW